MFKNDSLSHKLTLLVKSTTVLQVQGHMCLCLWVSVMLCVRCVCAREQSCWNSGG